MFTLFLRSFFLHDAQTAQFVRAVARGQDTSHIRFPWKIASQKEFLEKTLFETLRDKLTAQHLEQIAPSDLAHKYRVKFATLLMEKGATQSLRKHPRLAHQIDAHSALVLLSCAADTRTKETADDLLAYAKVMLKQFKQKRGPYKTTHILLDHSLHYGPNLLLWSYQNDLTSDRIINTILDLCRHDKINHPEIRAMFEDPSSHQLIKRETLFQHLDKHPEDAFGHTLKNQTSRR